MKPAPESAIRLLVVCKPGGTVNHVPVDVWVERMRGAGYDVTVRDPDAMPRGGVEFDSTTIDEAAVDAFTDALAAEYGIPVHRLMGYESPEAFAASRARSVR